MFYYLPETIKRLKSSDNKLFYMENKEQEQ